MWEGFGGGGSALVVLTVAFVATQSAYFVQNVLTDVLLFRRDAAGVDPARVPATLPRIHVLVPLYEESRAVVRETLDGLAAMDYPAERVAVCVVTEPDDAVVESYVDDLLASYVGTLDVERTTVDRRVVESYRDGDAWSLTGESVPRTKASALKYAFRTRSLPAEDVVTVFDADTVVPPDTFRLAVAGLESHEVVQAKQTVRNHADGWLPRLEAMGMAGWCHALYAKTGVGPYQLLGKAYFLRVYDLWALGDWRVDEITEDLALGVDAYRQGYSLGVIDRYVQDICPTRPAEWVTQKRRWVGGLYPHLTGRGFTARERVRLWVYGGSNQVVAVLNLVGVPAGALYLALSLTGAGLFYSPLLVALTGFNLLNWAYYSAMTYRATTSGVVFADRRAALAFYALVNPLTQLVYATLWSVPILLAVRDHVAGAGPEEFHVTPKRLDARAEEGVPETG